MNNSICNNFVEDLCVCDDCGEPKGQCANCGYMEHEHTNTRETDRKAIHTQNDVVSSEKYKLRVLEHEFCRKYAEFKIGDAVVITRASTGRKDIGRIIRIYYNAICSFNDRREFKYIISQERKHSRPIELHYSYKFHRKT